MVILIAIAFLIIAGEISDDWKCNYGTVSICDFNVVGYGYNEIHFERGTIMEAFVVMCAFCVSLFILIAILVTLNDDKK